MVASKFKKSQYRPVNRDKYRGNVDSIVCRSSPERLICRYLDLNSNVHHWSSEETIVPYFDESTGKTRRYFTDFRFTLVDNSEFLIEYKPKSQCYPPKEPRIKTKKALDRYAYESMVYIKNLSKWNAAKSWASSHGMIFQVWNEDHLAAIGVGKYR